MIYLQSYTGLKLLIEAGYIKTFQGIFDYVPRTRVAKDSQISPFKFKKLLSCPQDICTQDIKKISTAIKVPPELLSKIINAEGT